MPTASPLRIAGPRADGVQRQAARAGLPFAGRVGSFHRARSASHVAPAVGALEQRGMRDARLQICPGASPGLTIQMRSTDVSVSSGITGPSLWSTRPWGRRRVEHAWAVEPGGHAAKYRPVRGSRVANSTTSPANARVTTSNGSPRAGSPRRTNSPFFVPTKSSGLDAAQLPPAMDGRTCSTSASPTAVSPRVRSPLTNTLTWARTCPDRPGSSPSRWGSGARARAAPRPRCPPGGRAGPCPRRDPSAALEA